MVTMVVFGAVIHALVACTHRRQILLSLATLEDSFMHESLKKFQSVLALRIAVVIMNGLEITVSCAQR